MHECMPTATPDETSFLQLSVRNRALIATSASPGDTMSNLSLFLRSVSLRSLSGSRSALVVLTAMACAFFALPALAGSQARIVRLSDVQGSVQIDKNSGLGFESAFLNLPVMQGARLRTRGNGRVEIEFEDGSTMRLGPN